MIPRRAVLALLLLRSVAGVVAPGALTAQGAPKFAAPPGEETERVGRVIDRAAAALAAGAGTTAVLTDTAYASVRPWPRFRELIRRYADTTLLVLTTRDEPGEPLEIEGNVRSRDGRPIAGALLYVYHTSAAGWYADSAIHVSGNSGDERHARLFGYLRTDAAGRFRFRTIRPAGYPGSELPQHLHVEIRAEDTSGARVTEVHFADDPRLTDAMAARALREQSPVVTVVKREGVWRGRVDFVMR